MGEGVSSLPILSFVAGDAPYEAVYGPDETGTVINKEFEHNDETCDWIEIIEVETHLTNQPDAEPGPTSTK